MNVYILAGRSLIVDLNCPASVGIITEDPLLRTSLANTLLPFLSALVVWLVSVPAAHA